MNTELIKKYENEWKQIGEYRSAWGVDKREPMRNLVITERENFERLFRHEKPAYMPVSDDMTPFSPAVLPDHTVRAWALEIANPCLPGSDCKGGKDMFGVQWDYVPVTFGSMVRGDDPLVKDICHWEDYLTFPDLDQFDWEGSARGNAELFTDRRMTRVWLMNGLNERLISFLGFMETMIAYKDEEEKEAVKRLFDRLCTFYEDLLTRYRKYYGCDVLMFNDDWGTQRGPQFSPDTAREMLAPYMKRISDTCHKLGMYLELHSCGKNDAICEVFAESGVDLWLPQENINDYDLLYRLIGDRVILSFPSDSTPDMTDEECWESAERFMERFGKNGNVMLNTSFPKQHPRISEFLYYLSREAYAE